MKPNETGPWFARVNLKLVQAPGSIPSSIRIRAGETFYLDGHEGFDSGMAQRLGQIVLHDPTGPQPELLQEPAPAPRRRRSRKVTE